MNTTSLAHNASVGKFAGVHVLAELWGVSASLLNDAPQLCRVLTRSLTSAGATILDISSKRFDPQGVTALVLLAESHASIHTYPEHGSAFVDVFTCGTKADPEVAVRLLCEALHPTTYNLRTVRRGGAPRALATIGAASSQGVVSE